MEASAHGIPGEFCITHFKLLPHLFIVVFMKLETLSHLKLQIHYKVIVRYNVGHFFFFFHVAQAAFCCIIVADLKLEE